MNILLFLLATIASNFSYEYFQDIPDYASATMIASYQIVAVLLYKLIMWLDKDKE